MKLGLLCKIEIQNLNCNLLLLLFLLSLFIHATYIKMWTQSIRISRCKISVYFVLKKNMFFSILHTHFYKTPTSVCLFYTLFYLNNILLTFFYYFTATHGPTNFNTHANSNNISYLYLSFFFFFSFFFLLFSFPSPSFFFCLFSSSASSSFFFFC